MDPLSAFALAASVLQFVQFGMQVADRLQDYRSSNPNEIPKSLQAICTQLPLLLNAFKRINSETSLNKLDFDTKCILKGVVAGCMTQVGEIEDIVRQISNQPGQSLAVKMRKVFVSMKSEDKVWAIERNLHTYISVLILHHVVESSEAPERVPDDTYYFDVREERVSPFFPRDDLIRALGDQLRAASRSQVQTPTVVVLEGREGVGKTQLVLEYCHQANKLDQFRTVFWLDANSEEALCLGLESISATIRRTRQGTRAEKIEFVKKFLSELWHPWLLVLDNYQHFAWGDLVQYLPRSGYGGIIFVTRDLTRTHLGKVINVRKFLTAQERSRLDSSIAGAVQAKDLERVKVLVSEGADVNALVYNQWPCLHRAAVLGLPEMASFLLANGADPGHEALQDRPLYWAADGGYPAVVKILLDHDDSTGYVPTVQENNLAFRAAAEKGSLESVRLLLDRRELTLDAEDRSGRNALNLAAQKGHVEVVKLLLERGAYSKNDKSLERALLSAMSSSPLHQELAKVLCASGNIDPNASGENGSTALYYAASSKEEWSRKENGQDMTKFFLDLGADPNVLNGEGRGPLHEAALHDHTNTLKLLLQHGADPTIEDRMGYTPLLSAIKYKSPESASILRDIDIPDPAKRKAYMESTLKFAARNGDRDTILAIIEKGGDTNINCVDWKGKTPLLLAVDGEHQSTARLLAKRGAGQDIADEDGRLPLHVAAERGFDSVVKDLVREGKNCDMKNSKGETALCLAAMKGQEKVVEQLLKLGADRDLANKYGDTPLDLAEENHRDKIVQLLEGLEVR
ncbi:Ankyrin repeat domain-containing protein 44 [Lambiella insularis]|nr:Ankyrin repeat domain-containing protein 44 [Lambiella insularis]